MKNEFPVVLSIAGSDPSGGAGIQADIKTVSALGGYAAAAITAVTAQNTTGVKDVEYMSDKIVSRQIEAVMDDLDVDAVKIGMTGSVPVVAAISRTLKAFSPANIVVDPVMVSTSRHSLTLPEAVEVMCSELFPLARLVTPNINETSRLAGFVVSSLDDMVKAAESLYARYGCAFLVKGGDLAGSSESVDVLCDSEGIRMFSAPLVRTKNLHGTGCTLSSAIATYLAWGDNLYSAVEKGKRFVNAAIVSAAGLEIGKGNGPLWHFHNVKCDENYSNK